MAVNLTENFTLEEMTVTQHRDIDNSCPTDLVPNLAETANVLEQVRKMLKHPIIVTSGYRCPALNAAVGGSKNSRHMLGLAADFICPGYGPPADVCGAIAMSSIVFDQIINEMGRWIHIGLCEKGAIPRKDVLTLLGSGSYVRGIIQ